MGGGVEVTGLTETTSPVWGTPAVQAASPSSVATVRIAANDRAPVAASARAGRDCGTRRRT